MWSDIRDEQKEECAAAAAAHHFMLGLAAYGRKETTYTLTHTHTHTGTYTTTHEESRTSHKRSLKFNARDMMSYSADSWKSVLSPSYLL